MNDREILFKRGVKALIAESKNNRPSYGARSLTSHRHPVGERTPRPLPTQPRRATS